MLDGNIIAFPSQNLLGSTKKLCDFESIESYHRYVEGRCECLRNLPDKTKYDRYLQELAVESVANIIDWLIAGKISGEHARESAREHLFFLLTSARMPA